MSYHPYEEEEWSETYLTKEGIKLEISNFLTETVEKVISDVVDQYDISYENNVLYHPCMTVLVCMEKRKYMH